jgi:hypothetical protein
MAGFIPAHSRLFLSNYFDARNKRGHDKGMVAPENLSVFLNLPVITIGEQWRDLRLQDPP